MQETVDNDKELYERTGMFNDIVIIRTILLLSTNPTNGFDEAAPIVNFQSTMSNRVTYRHAIGSRANMKRS